MAIGVLTPSLQQFGMGSHNWGNGNNINAIKTAMMLQTGVLSRVSALPGSPSVNDRYLLTETSQICMWIDGFNDGEDNEPAQWVRMAPTVGMLLFVEDEEKFYVWRNTNVWEEALDLNETHHAVQREIPLYAPGRIRPNNFALIYVAAMELTIEAGAPGSQAMLDVAPSGGISFVIRHNNTPVGSISFGGGSTEGSVSFPSERIIYDAWTENLQVQAHALYVVSPADLKGAEGLSLTLRGKIRAMD